MDWAEFLLLWLIEAAWKGGLILLCALLLLSCRKQASAAQRHLTLSWAVLAAVVLPLWAMISPRWEIDLPSFLDLSPLRTVGFQTGVSGSTAATIWLIGAGLLISRQIGGHLALWRRIRRADAVHGPVWRLHRRILDSAGLRQPVPLRVSDEIASPLAAGMFRPALLIPRGCLDWPKDNLRLVFKHEIAHLRRHDNLIMAVAQLACAFYWFNPLAWLALRLLQVEQEKACDDCVLDSGEKASDYASMLLFAADRLKVESPAHSQLLPRFTLTRRLLAVLDKTAPRRPANAAQRRKASLSWATALVMLTVLTPAVQSLSVLTPKFAGQQAERPERVAEPALGSLPIGVQPPPSGFDGDRHRWAEFRKTRHLSARLFPLTDVAGDLTSPISPSVWVNPAPTPTEPEIRAALLRLETPRFVFARRERPREEDQKAGEDTVPNEPGPEEDEGETALEPVFEIIELGGFGFGDAAAYDVNHLGIAVGAAELSSVLHPVIWSAQAEPLDVGLPEDFLAASALRINDQGQVLVRALKLGPSRDIVSQLFLWSRSNGYERVGNLSGCRQVFAADLNESGLVLGVCELYGARNAGARSFVWSEGRLIDLGSLDGAAWAIPLASTVARDVNNRGQVVGTSNQKAFIWTARDGMRPIFDAREIDRLGLPPDTSLSSHAFAVNQKGEVVGHVSLPSGNARAFRWSAEEGVRLLETPADVQDLALHVRSGAFSISDRGTVFGTSLGIAQPGAVVWRKSFRWSPDEGASELAEVSASQDWGGLQENRRVNSGDDFVGQNWSQSGPVGLSGRIFAFAHVAGWGMVDLAAPLESFESSEATAVNQSGDVVGYGRGYDFSAGKATTPFRAFLWRRVQEGKRP